MGVDSMIFLLIASKESKTDEMGSREIVCGAGGHEEKDEIASLAWWYIPAVSALGQEGYKLETSLGYLYIARPSLKNLERKTDKNRLSKKNGGENAIQRCKLSERNHILKTSHCDF